MMMDKNAKAFAIIALCGIVGVVIALLLQAMYGAGILIDEYISGTLTLRELQVGVIVVWLIVGSALVAAEQ